MKLSEHFSLAEATFSQNSIRLGIDNTPSPEQLSNMIVAATRLEMVRDVLECPLIITSWLRVMRLDKEIGGSGSAKGHSSGFSIDFLSPQFGSPEEIVDTIHRKGIKYDQLICEGDWAHISFHPAMRQQTLRAIFKRGEKTKYTPFKYKDSI